jgi:hypothetical protein
LHGAGDGDALLEVVMSSAGPDLRAVDDAGDLVTCG